MSALIKSNFSFTSKAYFSLTKPGIIFGNAINLTTGFILGSKGSINLSLLLMALIGLSLIVASGCVFNNYIDKDLDEKMIRTRNRVLVKGVISPKSALLFAIIQMLAGIFFLAIFTNFLTLAISFFGLVVYVFLYTFLKYHSSHGTLVGSIAGAIPPVVGYCAVTNCLDIGALILFAIIALWQMPHFFAISIFRLEDFRKAMIPVLPIKKGIYATKIQMMCYIIAFTITLAVLTVFGYTGYSFLIVTCGLSLFWLRLCIKGFKCSDDNLWARQVFRFSLVIILAIFIMISFSKISLV